MAQYQAVLELSDLDGNNGFQINGEFLQDFSGFSVSAAGNVNGDGFDDVIVGAYGVGREGAAYVVFGKASGFAPAFSLNTLNGTNGFQINGETQGDVTGYSVSDAGDVNGDGFDDVIVGAPKADPHGSFSGASFVVFGKASGFGTNFALSGLDGNNGFQLSGEAADDYSGRSVSSAGDVNGDGFDDLIVGAKGFDSAYGNAGASYVVFGKASGFAATLNLSSLNGNNGFQITGEATNEYSGVSVASAGDVNGDGFDDVLVGAARHGFYANGAAYIVFGKASGFAATLDLSDFNLSGVARIYGQGNGDYVGISVASAGDVNGDGFADVIVGAGEHDPNIAAAYVLFGGNSGFGLSIDGANGFRINGEGDNGNFGLAVSGAGDFNGDGFDDLIVGADLAGVSGNNPGAAYIVFGKASGFAATLELSSLDGNNGFHINGEADDDLFGHSVSAAGDVNGDGLDDVIVGAHRADPNGSASGASYVIFGTLPGQAVVRTGTASANDIHGSNFDDELRGLGADDTLTGYDGDDMVLGADGNDNVETGSGDDFARGGSGDDRIDGGADTDELKGGSGLDVLAGGTGSDALDGGSGDDTLNGDDGNDTLAGGDGTDTLNGGNGDDRLDGGDGRDTLNGGAGVDRFVYGTSADSTSTGYDIVKNADFAADKWDVASAITKIDPAIATGALSNGSFDADLAAAANATLFKKYHAVLFTPDAGGHAGKTFLLIDQNGVNGYQAGVDLVIELKTAANLGNIDAGDFI